MQRYMPTCPACRALDKSTFYVSCSGCQVRRSRAEAAKTEPPVTKQQAADMDSMMGQLA